MGSMVSPPVQNSNEQRPRSQWPLALTVLAVLGLGCLGLAGYFFHTARSLPGDLIEQGRSLLGDARSVAEGFRKGTVTTRFISYAAEMSGSKYLQFTTLKEIEVFERKDSATVLWGQFALPDVVVRAEAPVEYTYYLDLDEPWDLLLEEHAVVVHAPAIRYNTPAIDVSNIRYEVADRSILRDEEEALENLRKGLSQLSKQRAQENVSLVRELGRKQTAEFIRTWLMASYDDADAYRIDVVFADEARSEPTFTELPR